MFTNCVKRFDKLVVGYCIIIAQFIGNIMFKRHNAYVGWSKLLEISEVSEKCMKSFCNVNFFKPHVKEPTCFKNPSNPSCIDLFLTSR